MKIQYRISARMGLVIAVSLATTAVAHAKTDTTTAVSVSAVPIVARFENFGEKDGLPPHKIHSVLKTSDGTLWVGSNDGLCVRQPDGRFRRYGPADGLSHGTVLGLAEDPVTGDLWIATMQGLSRFSAGHFTAFTQTNSGLPNNVVYGVAVSEGTIWAATAAGAGAYDLKAKSWKIYDQSNTVMNEPWCYGIALGKGVVYLGIWAGGVLEHDPKTGSFKAFRDPDGDFHLQLAPDSGPIIDITSGIAFANGMMWQASYFGLARYDATKATWRTWVQNKTPLVSNFINTVFAHGDVAWAATDRGVSATDGNTWVNYLVDEKGRGVVEIHRTGQQTERHLMTTALADAFVLAVWADDHEAWFATSNGLSRGIFAPANAAATVTSNP